MFCRSGVGGGCIEDADDEKFGISFTFMGFSGFDFYKQLELWYSPCMLATNPHMHAMYIQNTSNGKL